MLGVIHGKISKVEVKPFTSSLNICPDCRRNEGGTGGATFPLPTISYKAIRGFLFEDDTTVILLLGSSFMGGDNSSGLNAGIYIPDYLTVKYISIVY